MALTSRTSRRGIVFRSRFSVTSYAMSGDQFFCKLWPRYCTGYPDFIGKRNLRVTTQAGIVAYWSSATRVSRFISLRNLLGNTRRIWPFVPFGISSGDERDFLLPSGTFLVSKTLENSSHFVYILFDIVPRYTYPYHWRRKDEGSIQKRHRGSFLSDNFARRKFSMSDSKIYILDH